MRPFLLLGAILVLGLGLSYAALRRGDEGRELSRVEQAIELAGSQGCLACHTLDGSAGIGPSWLGIWGRERRFAGGGSAIVDAAYLNESMLSPAARVVEGFDKVMLPTGLGEAERELIVELIRELGAGAAPAQ